METETHVIIESTAGCSRLPVLAFAVEELHLEYALRVQPDGFFESTFGTLGPALTIDGDQTVGLDAALTRLAVQFARPDHELAALEEMIAYHRSVVRPAIVGILRGDAESRARLGEAMDELDARIGKGGPWLDADFGLADCLNAPFHRVSGLGVDLAARASLAAYVSRLTARDAFTRAARRLQELR